MADGDKVHDGLDRRWQDAYKQICQWAHNKEAIVETVAERLKNDIKYYGEEPRALLWRLSDLLTSLRSNSVEVSRADYAAVRWEAENLIQQMEARPVAVEGVRRAFQQQLQDLKYGKSTGDEYEMRIALMSKYVNNIYATNFEDHCPFNPGTHFEGVDSATVRARLSNIRADLNNDISAFAVQMAADRENRVSKLRMAPHKRNHNVDENHRVKRSA